MFTDEKIFTVDGYFNPKNNGVWADDRSCANMNGGVFGKQKYPAKVMVALGATWNGLTEPYFFEEKKRLNTQDYLEVLTVYKSEGNRLFKSTKWNFQQDGAPIHTSNQSQNWCKNNFAFFIPKDKWPPNSPELNPLDYSIQNKISNDIDYKNVTIRNDLIKKIKKSISEIDINYLREVIGSFLRRVYSVEKNNGELIINEHS